MKKFKIALSTGVAQVEKTRRTEEKELRGELATKQPSRCLEAKRRRSIVGFVERGFGKISPNPLPVKNFSLLTFHARVNATRLPSPKSSSPSALSGSLRRLPCRRLFQITEKKLSQQG